MTGLIIATGLAAIILACGLAVLITVLLHLLRPRRPARVVRLADPAPLPGEPGDDTIRMLYRPCAPCNGQPGRCTCAGLCGHKDCVGDHTMTWQMAAELQQLLAEPNPDELGRP